MIVRDFHLISVRKLRLPSLVNLSALRVTWQVPNQCFQPVFLLKLNDNNGLVDVLLWRADQTKREICLI